MHVEVKCQISFQIPWGLRQSLSQILINIEHYLWFCRQSDMKWLIVPQRYLLRSKVWVMRWSVVWRSDVRSNRFAIYVCEVRPVLCVILSSDGQDWWCRAKIKKLFVSLLSPLLSDAEAEPSTVEFYPSAFPVRRLQGGIDIIMDLGANQSVTSCEFWVDEHNTTDQNWSDIQTEYLELCVGPQRWDNSPLNLTCLLCSCRLPHHILYPLSVVYIIMGLTGTIGNTMVQVVIVR